MTKEQLNEKVRAMAKAHGFETTEVPRDFDRIASEEMNFTITSRLTEGTDWAAGRIEQSLMVVGSVRKMGGNPTVEELLKTADEIRRGAELLRELQEADLRWTETF